MIDHALISRLKQSNVSVDKEKTKQRVRAIWRGASKQQRMSVIELADVKVTTINRIYTTGSISTKLAVPLSLVLGANPFYLTGESDENVQCTEEIVLHFLEAKGYQKLLKENRKRSKDGSSLLSGAKPQEDLAQEVQLSDEELSHLFKALLIRAKVDSGAKADLEAVKRHLI